MSEPQFKNGKWVGNNPDQEKFFTISRWIIIFTVIGLPIAAFIFNDDTNTFIEKSFSFLVLFAVFFILKYVISKNVEAEDKKLKEDKEHIEKKSDKYKKKLAIKRSRLLITDDYGDVDDSKWKKEISYFLKSKIGFVGTPQLSVEQAGKIVDEIAKEAQKVKKLKKLKKPYSDKMTGIEYEHFCANILTKEGWNAEVSKGSGDQGADIIAEKDDVKIVIQCKRYATSVGNKAVQEVIAGKTYYAANAAVVVTNNNFTKSAKALAESADVILLHHTELDDINACLWDIGVKVSTVIDLSDVVLGKEK
jgi:restriction system protein